MSKYVYIPKVMLNYTLLSFADLYEELISRDWKPVNDENYSDMQEPYCVFMVSSVLVEKDAPNLLKHLDERDHAKNKVFLWVIDLAPHGEIDTTKTFYDFLCGFDGVFFAYKYYWDELCNLNKLPPLSNTAWLPHFASDLFIQSENPEISLRKKTIAVTGAVNEQYKFRTLMSNQSSDTVTVYGHCGWPNEINPHTTINSKLHGKEFAKVLGSHFAAFTDSVQHNNPATDAMRKRRYVVAKYFEIPACGTLLFCDTLVKKELRELGFEPMVHYFPTTFETLTNDIQNMFLLDEGTIKEMANRGRELVLQKHSRKQRADEIENYVKKWFFEKL